MGEDVDSINEQITKITRLPNAPDRSIPHLGKTGHNQDPQQQQYQQKGSMGGFSAIIPIYLGLIFVFFIYIVGKIIMKKIDDKEEIVEEEETDPGDAYKDDGWWSKLTERITKVGECVKAGKDLETEDEDEEDETDVEESAKKNDNNEEDNPDEDTHENEYSVLEERLEKQEKSLESLSCQMDQLSGLVTSQSQLLQQLLIQLKENKDKDDKSTQ